MHTFSQSSSIWHPRQQCGNYQLLKLLGQGGFADVYLGEHIYLHTRAAIKIVRSLDEFDVNTFFDEARLAARLRHAHIIRVLDFDIVLYDVHVIDRHIVFVLLIAVIDNGPAHQVD